jgi:hypothetical protein
MIALCCPKCGAFVIAADCQVGGTVSCQACPAGIPVPADAPKDNDLARVMKKALHRYKVSVSDTRIRSVSDTAARRLEGLPGTDAPH